ncbi:MAG: lysine--tRNA ligase [Elusimicrobiaceae bacterium]|nr:lysine--tRNA ligase [Elusimicrobiaceae bacterium]
MSTEQQHNNTLDSIIKQRYQEVEEIRQLGVTPYPNRCEKQISCADAKKLAENADAVTAGRLMQIRLMGKAAFAHLRDFSGRIQLYIAKDNLGDEAYTFFKKHIAVGDFVSVTGHIFVTKTGEKTIKVTKMTLLSKAIRPMPEKYHGLQDTEVRFRKRHLDLIANEAVKDIFVKRAKIISSIRKTLDDKGFLEVETPILNPSSGGAIARPFETYHNALKMPLYMRIALELHHKRLIIGGLDRIYEIGHMFRNEGIDTTHNPEFTMMELYQAYGDVNTMADLFDEILGNAAKAIGVEKVQFRGYEVDLRPPYKRLYIPVAWQEKFGRDIHEVLDGRKFNRAKLEEVAREQGIKFSDDDSDSDIFDELFEGKLLADYHNPVIALDYPTAVSPFSKTKPGDPELVERFEVFVNGQELGNAYTELNDPADQLQRLKDQAAAKAIAKGEDAKNADILDADYIEAMESGMPPTGGMGIGIDRIIMMLTGQDSIREIIFFPTLKKLDEEKEDR